MWQVTKEDLRGHKKIKVDGIQFVIKKLNPILDFKSDKIPQIFTEFKSMRPVDPTKTPEPKELERMYRDMMTVVEAGVVEIVGHGPLADKAADGITAEDLFRNSKTGFKLYFEIMDHSLAHFKGLKGVFFWINRKLSLLMLSRRNMVSVP